MNPTEIVGQLKSQSTWRLFLLCFITLGIYTAHYIKRQSKILNQHLDSELLISEGFTNVILILSYMSVILFVPYLFVEGGHLIGAISDLLDFVWGILIIIWAFMARNRMNILLAVTKDQTGWFHGLWTFLFTAFYFNFKINKLVESLAEHNALQAGDSTPLQPRQ